MKVIHVSRQSVHQHVIKARTRKHVPVQKPFITVLTHSGFSFSNLASPVKVCWKLTDRACRTLHRSESCGKIWSACGEYEVKFTPG